MLNFSELFLSEISVVCDPASSVEAVNQGKTQLLQRLKEVPGSVRTEVFEALDTELELTAEKYSRISGRCDSEAVTYIANKVSFFKWLREELEISDAC